MERAGPDGAPRVIVVMPGPPAEMHVMWDADVAPALERRAEAILVSRTLKTTGVGESTIDECVLPFRSIDTSGSSVTSRMPCNGPEAAAALSATAKQFSNCNRKRRRVT